MSDIEYEIIEYGDKIGATSAKGWTTEINKVSWNGRDAKWEIRPWNEEHTKCGKGYVFQSDEEMSLLGEFLVNNGYA